MLCSFSLVVPEAGFQPARAFAHIILSDACLAVPSLRHSRGHDRIQTGVNGFADRHLIARSRGLYIFTLPHFLLNSTLFHFLQNFFNSLRLYFGLIYDKSYFRHCFHRQFFIKDLLEMINIFF